MGGRARLRDSPGFFGWVGPGGVPIYTIPNFRAIGVREHRQNGQKPVFDFGFWAKVQLFGTLEGTTKSIENIIFKKNPGNI